MQYDRGYGRDYQSGRGGGMGRYDYGLRGYRETAPARRQIPLRTYGRGGYDRGWSGHAGLPNRVTQRYNMEYVHPQPNRLETNYSPFGGDVEGRIVDPTGYWGAYNTTGGSRTWRGGGLPVGWERGPGYGDRYDREFRGYGRDYHGPMR
jgi:hypothetical protein